MLDLSKERSVLHNSTFEFKLYCFSHDDEEQSVMLLLYLISVMQELRNLYSLWDYWSLRDSVIVFGS